MAVRSAYVYAGASQHRISSCKKPINSSTSHSYNVFIYTQSSVVGGFYELGGSSTTSDKGVNWACNHYRSNGDFIGAGIIFIMKDVTISEKIPTYSGSRYKYPVYTFNLDVDASSGATSTATLGGLVHYNGETSSNNYAIHIGFCTNYNDCRPAGGTGNASVNWSAAVAGAGGIIQRSGYDDISVTRMRSGVNGSQNSFGNWTEPYIGFGSWPTVTINNQKLKEAVDNGTVEWTPISSGSRTGTVTIYIQRCWSGNGSTMGGSDTCEAGKVYLITKLPPKEEGWTATFNGKIDASVSGATAKTENGKVIYYTDQATPTVTFTHYHRRSDNNDKPSSASGSWKSFPGKAASAVDQNTSTSFSGTPSLAKNSSWALVHSHTTDSGDVNLSAGQSVTVCDSMGFYAKRTSTDGTNSSLSDWTERESCITFKRYDRSHTFEGKVTGTATVNGTSLTMGATHKVDFDKAKVKFVDNICRIDTEAPDDVNSNWKAYKVASSSITSTNHSKSGTDSLKKKNVSGACKDVWTDDRGEVTLNLGDNYFYNSFAYYATIKDSGAVSTSLTTKQAWVNIYRYSWFTMSGRVTPNTNATNRNGVYWTDTNSANLQFIHQFSTESTVAIKPKYKTSKNPNPGPSFDIVTDYTQGDKITKSNGWYDQYKSPTTATTVNVAKDTGTKYCQTLNYYTKVREDSGAYNTATSTESCIQFKRYKTTFTGTSEIFVKNDTSKNYNGETIDVTGSSYPVTVPITFKHTVTRSSSDADGSPAKKSSNISTVITDTKGYRSGDPHGTALNPTDTVALAPGESDDHTDTFTIKIYPEQTITLCQQMTYRSEIQGAENTATASPGQVCVTIRMAKATCLDKEFGIKDAKNYLQVKIYKNNNETANKSSGVKSDGSTTITAWAKPGDQIRYNYDACAGGELAQQYDVNNSQTTTYNIKANANGYLFGDEINASPYTEINKELGRSNGTIGKGPFSEKYTVAVTSPHGDNIYSCDFYGTNGIADFYRIPAYIEGLTQSNYRDACKSDDYGRVNDLGTTITHTATWTDIQYTGGKPINDHNGKTAKIIANVKIPYNYKTDIDTSGDGGYIIPGMPHTEKIVLNIEPRRNTPANGANDYATVTKPTKYRLIEIIIDEDRTETSDYFNNLVNGNKYLSDEDGTKNLRRELDVCKHFSNSCTIVRSGNGKRYDPRNNTATGQELDSYTMTVPYDADPGLKYCYVSAVWPSDSHNLPTANDLTEEQNAAGLTETGNQWHVSGATCYTVAKRPSIHILGGDTYAQGYISARVQKYPINNNGDNPRIYGSWSEYAAISGLSLKGFASGATLWGGSSIVASAGDIVQSCSFSAYTFANAECKDDKLGEFGIDTTTSSNPETIANQIITRYTRTDNTGAMNPTNSNPIAVKDGGFCEYDDTDNTYKPKDREAGATFACIGDTGAKYTHVKNVNGPVAYIPNDTNYCMIKGDTNSNRTSIIHADGTLIIGTNIVYGNTKRQYSGQGTTDAGMCYEDLYNSISEIPQSIMIAKKIIIKENVKHVDSWLIADEIITCDPDSHWRGDVPITDINTNNCDTQLTINGPVMTKNLKLYRTYGTGFTYDSWGNKINTKASPAEIFTMGPETYLWSFNQAQRYSQATTTYARELAPRY
ncbi:hypothetical protein IJM16_01180 [Candidatus Saccharibacteria bacterium]|nr:hypothetical protein [Candidatus Saccharibacteria bacterium]